MKKRAAIFIGVVLGLMVLYFSFVHYQEPNQIALSWNIFNGEKRCETRGGYHFNPPWVWVARIDTRPVRVCVTSRSRAFNCKLVEFEPAGWKEFLANEGWRWYWWDNRLSFNYGHSETYRGVRDLMRGYAYSSKRYPFVKVLEEYPDH
jgi:hypothetical protein